jgi:hypothetical protein
MPLLPERRERALRDALRSVRTTYRRHARAPEPPSAVVRRDDPDVVLDVAKLRVDEIEHAQPRGGVPIEAGSSAIGKSACRPQAVSEHSGACR